MTLGLKQRLGAAAIDLPRYEMVLRFPRLAERLLGLTWIDLANRRDRLRRSEDGRGVQYDGRWSVDLFLCKGFPSVGRRLMRRALSDWPVACAERASGSGDGPLVSFVIGHRGVEREPLLRTTLQSILAQEHVRTECIVVEQAAESVLKDLPSGVRHIHTPPPDPELPYCRAWAFNVGVRVALGDIVVCHDNDVCVPRRYAAELVRIFEHHRVEAAQLQRFIFYLSRQHTEETLTTGRIEATHPPERVRQNLQGMSIALRRDAYCALGGHDESFIGWGGEDNEFFDRCQTLRHYMYGYLPLVHLWHQWQPGKGQQERSTGNLFVERSRLSPDARIAELCARDWGSVAGPTG